MLRRQSARVVAPLVLGTQTRQYVALKGLFSNPERRPQLTEEQRSKVKINQDEWPEMFKDYNPEDPYRKAPNWIHGMNTWDYVIWGIEFAFVATMIENVFPSMAAL